ncbi:MAG TPA: GNAT family N-acetyltransferase [Nakamurella sp.]|jgi:GNAT superfamily N-acetyltransferase|nr:GNAT family N-acetyltransferase [Nakamurella sp.]
MPDVAAGTADQRGASATEELHFRRARAEDVAPIVAMMADDHLGAQRESPDDLAPYLAAFQAIDADPNQLLAVVELAGEVVGTLQVIFLAGLGRRGATKALVQAVRVASRLRSRGIGAAMMAWAAEQARARGCTLIQLTTHASRGDAHRFYDRLGYQHTHRGYTLPL